MLQRGAARVYAIDVGQGQLDWKLRQDERVAVMERTNARYLLAAPRNERWPGDMDIDASFSRLVDNLTKTPLENIKRMRAQNCHVAVEIDGGRVIEEVVSAISGWAK